ncbi:MAG: hypothetical protein K8R69_05225 [Deltaproteobacteria bacterium]|nr:hypothetical protein [Deltaproteobacteria bacterium]
MAPATLTRRRFYAILGLLLLFLLIAMLLGLMVGGGALDLRTAWNDDSSPDHDILSRWPSFLLSPRCY